MAVRLEKTGISNHCEFQGSSSKALFNFAPRELLSITQAKFLCKRLFRVLLKSFLRRVQVIFDEWNRSKMRKEPREPLDRDHLLLFRTLCAPHNLQRAASQLGMPQATASRSLTKLREAFEDELFTRCSGGLTPTPKALALEPKVAAVIASFEDLFVEETFDPASLVREFRIACADHAMFYIGPAVTLASRTAPGVTFRLSPNGDDWVVELQRGDLDFLNNLATEVGGYLRLFL